MRVYSVVVQMTGGEYISAAGRWRSEASKGPFHFPFISALLVTIFALWIWVTLQQLYLQRR